MVTVDALKEQFEILGCSVENEEALNKCIEFCIEFGKDEEQFVEMWVAFSVSKFGNMDLTLEGLQQMERAERVEQKKEKHAPKAATFIAPSQLDIIDDDEILQMYGVKAPVTPKTKRLRSPDFGSSGPENKLFAVESVSSLSPSIPSRSSIKSGPGKVLVYYGEKIKSWKNEKHVRVTINRTDDPHVPNDAGYMFDVITDAAAQRAVACMKLGKKVCKKWSKIQDDTLVCTSDVKKVFQTNFVTWGRVRCDMQGKLNKVSTELEGIFPYRDLIGDMKIKSNVVPVDLSKVAEYSIFPGQILAVEGTNITGNLLEAKNVFSNGYAIPSNAPKLKTDINIMIAAGPFTAIDDLSYEPLINLLDRIKEEEPHVLILIGPFVEYTHPQIGCVLNHRTYQDLFEKTIRTVMENLKRKCTQVVIVASYRDAHHEPVYPTPQYYLPRSLQNPNLHSVPDPCMLNIDGLTIGISAVDILKHLGNEELSSNSFRMGKLSRLANHILSQACFYPLYPPAEEVNVDTYLWKTYAFMKQQPHILILPSDMAYFCKPINGCVVVNPERLCKHSFARMFIPSSSYYEKWDQSRISCEILKV